MGANIAAAVATVLGSGCLRSAAGRLPSARSPTDVYGRGTRTAVRPAGYGTLMSVPDPRSHRPAIAEASRTKSRG